MYIISYSGEKVNSFIEKSIKRFQKNKFTVYANAKRTPKRPCVGWDSWTRTSKTGVKVPCVTVTPYPNVISAHTVYHIFDLLSICSPAKKSPSLRAKAMIGKIRFSMYSSSQILFHHIRRQAH